MARRVRTVDVRNPAQPLVCVDLNGVLDSYTGWRHPHHWDPPRPGARQFLRALTRHRFAVVVFTTRHPAGVRRWLREHGLLPHVAAITDRKPPAHVFIDDRAVCFRGDFGATLDHVLSFKAHWEPQSAGAGLKPRATGRTSAARSGTALGRKPAGTGVRAQSASSARKRPVNSSRRRSKRRASADPSSD